MNKTIELERVPHFTTAVDIPVYEIEERFLLHQAKIENWFRQQWQLTPPPLYSSVDIRNAGFKIAAIDTNLFSAGFNNLNPDFLPLCVQALQSTMSELFPCCQRILIIPENHTRNMFYFENLAVLQMIFSQAGYDVRIGSLLENLREKKEIDLPSGKKILLEPIQRKGNRLGVEQFDPCLIVLNHDLASGVPEILKNIEQPVTPSLSLGWETRSKSNHFKHYQDACNELAKIIEIDPWLMQPIFRHCGKVDFLKNTGEDCLIHQLTTVLTLIREQYAKYHIPETPYAVIKADAGTYGLGVLMVNRIEQLQQLNRRQRQEMSRTKGNRKIDKVIIQEGIYTFERWGKENSVAEPVVYMIGKYVVGGFYRVHTQKSADENLNSPGMQFELLAFAEPCNTPERATTVECVANRFYLYGVIARLAAVAAAREMKEIQTNE